MTTASHRHRILKLRSRPTAVLAIIALAVLATATASLPVQASEKYTSFWSNSSGVKRSIDMTVPINVGTQFRTSSAGQVIGIRIYLMGSRPRTNSVALYDARGRALATASFEATRATGWRNVTFRKPVSLPAGSSVTAAAFLPFGHWAYSPRELTRPTTHGALTAIRGSYTFAKHATFPKSATKDALLVDLMFVQTGAISQRPPVPSPSTSSPSTTSSPHVSTSTTTKPTTTPSKSTTSTTSKPSKPSASTTTTVASTQMADCSIKPGASNTGAHGTLKSSAVRTVDKAGTVLQNVSLSDSLTVYADNVTVRNVKVNGTIVVRGSGVTVEHVTAEGVAVSSARNVVVQYANLSGGNDASGVTSDRGTQASNITLRYNYIHNPNPSPSAHYDGTQVRGVNGLKILCSNYDLGAYQSTYNASIYMENANGGTKNVTVANNWIDGGGFALYVNASNLSVTGNQFGTDARWGPCRNTAAKFASSGNTLSGKAFTPCG